MTITAKPDHKLTEWFSGREYVPQHIGEYNASIGKWGDLLRWWDGEYWSEPYMAFMPDAVKARVRRKTNKYDNHRMHFRGLIAKPRVHSLLYLSPLKELK